MSADTATSVAAIRLGLHALRENALGTTADHEDQTAVLQAHYDDRAQSGSVLGMVSGLLTDIGVRIEELGEEDHTGHDDSLPAACGDGGHRTHLAGLGRAR